MKLKQLSLTAITAAVLGSRTSTASAEVITDWNRITVNSTKVAPAFTGLLAVENQQVAPEPATLTIGAAGFGLFALLVLRRPKP
jgi:hypothetical protein